MNIIPEIFVSLMFYSCGAWMALNVYIGISDSIYESVILWPEFVGIISACLVGVSLFVTRIVWKKVVFVHFYLLGCGATLLVICGVLCIISTESSIPALYVGAIGHGVIYIAGLCYIHFRASGRRAFRLALCHFVYILGYTTTTHGVIIYGNVDLFYTAGNFIVYSAATSVLFFLINELCHGLGLYDYKKCLDSELHLANEKKDNFQSALDQQTASTTSDANYWATRLNVQPIVFSAPKKTAIPQQNILTLGLILSKFKNALIFLQVFMVFTILTTAFIGQGLEFIYLYFLLGGVIFGCVISLTVNAKHLYIVYTLAFSISILTASVLFSVGEDYNDESAVFFWLFYFFLGFGYFLPDIGILDMSNLQFTEIAFAGGFFVQYFLVALTRFGHWQFVNPQEASTLLWKYTGSFVGISLLLLIIIAVLYPKTLNLSLLDIQYAILFNEDRWKAKNHEILAAGAATPVSSQPNPRPAPAPSQQSDERPAFIKAQSNQGSLQRPVSRNNELPMFHHPWYPQHPPNIPLQTNGQGTNGLDNPAFDYGSVKARQMVPRINNL